MFAAGLVLVIGYFYNKALQDLSTSSTTDGDNVTTDHKKET